MYLLYQYSSTNTDAKEALQLLPLDAGRNAVALLYEYKF